MSIVRYKGFILKLIKQDIRGVWEVKIGKHKLTGSIEAVKKSIDWFCETSVLIEPKEFGSLGNSKISPIKNSKSKKEKKFHGYLLKNDTGDVDAWYCLFEQRLLKGRELAIKKYIEERLMARLVAHNK